MGEPPGQPVPMESRQECRSYGTPCVRSHPAIAFPRRDVGCRHSRGLPLAVEVKLAVRGRKWRGETKAGRRGPRGDFPLYSLGVAARELWEQGTEDTEGPREGWWTSRGPQGGLGTAQLGTQGFTLIEH